ncbi:hypothetical protein [Lysobacter sp. Root690]|uniref:hypothetical protein n=1 Tax=Lysobacter sp. Root690 TaxID=1736588 RepID=UPI00138F7467|nr:hypothetical protein [Lysobacter sp. Root690]
MPPPQPANASAVANASNATQRHALIRIRVIDMVSPWLMMSCMVAMSARRPMRAHHTCIDVGCTWDCVANFRHAQAHGFSIGWSHFFHQSTCINIESTSKRLMDVPTRHSDSACAIHNVCHLAQHSSVRRANHLHGKPIHAERGSIEFVGTPPTIRQFAISASRARGAEARLATRCHAEARNPDRKSRNPNR